MEARRRGAPRKEVVRVKVTRTFSPELLKVLDDLTDNQSEFIEECLWEHPLFKDRKPTVRKYIEIRLRADQLDLQDQINERCKGVWHPTPREPFNGTIIGVSCDTDTSIIDELGVEYRLVEWRQETNG